jgi:CubicO group peptidase (beta-lactamase class C family)
VPSQAPPPPRFAPTSTTDGVAGLSGVARVAGAANGSALVGRAVEARLPDVIAPDVDSIAAALLHDELDAWRARWSVPGVRAGVLIPDRGVWVGASGVDGTGVATQPDDRFDIGSVTKTFTGALVFQLATEGVIDLDAPVPPLVRVPTFPNDAGITVRQLLEHRSGLVPYRDVPGFAQEAARSADPATVLAAALRSAPLFAPGTDSAYSSTNYLVLGFLLEQVTGQPYDDLLGSRLLRPFGLDTLEHLPPGPLAPNFAAAGIVADGRTLLRWAVALYRSGLAVDAAAVAAMHQIDTTTGLGPAVYGYCPCTVDEDGTASWRWLGHSGGTTQLVYSETDDVAIVIDLTDSLWLDDRGRAVAELQEVLRVRMLELVAPPTLVGHTDEAATDAPGSTER